MKGTKIRLQKHLSECGVASRRKAEELIAAGRVRVNGRIASIGDKVDPIRDKVTVGNKNVVRVKEKYYIMLHKPRGYVTTMNDERDRRCVAQLVRDVPARVFPVGRLDKDSEGLLIMTNDGELTNLLTHPKSHVTKIYRVTVRGKVSDEQLVRLQEGVMLDGEKTLPCDVAIIELKADRTVLRFGLVQGKNRQIRRMCEQLGLEVMRLKRTEIAGVKLGMLPPGQWRDLNEKEMKHLENISKITIKKN